MNGEGMSIFTDGEIAFLSGQKLGRLATKVPDGTVQNNPVGYFVHDDYVDIGGHGMGASRKFHNIQADPRVSLVIDDVSTDQGWQVRGIEIRGRAEAIEDAEPPMRGFSRELIRIIRTGFSAGGSRGAAAATCPELRCPGKAQGKARGKRSGAAVRSAVTLLPVNNTTLQQWWAA